MALNAESRESGDSEDSGDSGDSGASRDHGDSAASPATASEGSRQGSEEPKVAVDVHLCAEIAGKEGALRLFGDIKYQLLILTS